IGWMFESGHIPEFLKSLAVFIVVILVFTFPDELVHGTGLLSVTAMSLTLSNLGIISFNDLRSFNVFIFFLLFLIFFIVFYVLIFDILIIKSLYKHEH